MRPPASAMSTMYSRIFMMRTSTEMCIRDRYTAAEKRVMIDKLTKEMKAAAKLLEFEHAALSLIHI